MLSNLISSKFFNQNLQVQSNAFSSNLISLIIKSKQYSLPKIKLKNFFFFLKKFKKRSNSIALKLTQIVLKTRINKQFLINSRISQNHNIHRNFLRRIHGIIKIQTIFFISLQLELFMRWIKFKLLVDYILSGIV